jgi:chromosome segregation ATPase
LAQRKADRLELVQRVKHIYRQNDEATAEKASQCLKHKEIIEKIKRCHEGIIEASVRFIEGDSDVEALRERNQDTVRRVEEEKQLAQIAERDAQAAFQRAGRAMEVVQEITAEARAAGTWEYFKSIPADKTVEMLQTEIDAEANKLSYIHAGNPNAIRDFERRQVEVDDYKERVTKGQEELDRLARHITRIRGKWEPELDNLIAEISEAFSFNFEQIGCAGEVGIHKDEDFDKWAIQIKVKFRYAVQKLSKNIY